MTTLLGELRMRSELLLLGDVSTGEGEVVETGVTVKRDRGEGRGDSTIKGSAGSSSPTLVTLNRQLGLGDGSGLGKGLGEGLGKGERSLPLPFALS